MWRRFLLGAVAMTVSGAISEYVGGIPDPMRRARTIEVLQDLKRHLAGSSNSTRRAIAGLIPF